MTERERLIELLKMVEYQYTIMCSIFTENVADWLLQHGVIVPPCKAGDTVYCENEEYEIYQFYFRSENKTETPAIRFFAECMYNANCDDIDFWDYEIGKTVFLTREEAEAALKKRESDGE